MHERLRTHAESVAFFGGGAREKAVSYIFSLDAHFLKSNPCAAKKQKK